MAETPLWKSCADWLCQLEVLPDNHRILWPDATIQDLAYALRDGVLLCHVASTISPEAVDQRNVNQRPQMAQFLCLKNIRVFLTAIRDSFMLKETDLFQPSMLYDYTDFARVLHTLSILSHCAVTKAKRPDVQGFPARNNSGGASHATSSSVALTSSSSSNNNRGSVPTTPTLQIEEDIYRTLADLVDEDQYKDFYYQHHGGAVSYGRQGRQGSQQYYMAIDQDEDIYEDLCAFKREGASSSKFVCDVFVPKEKRDYCLKELVETEAKYVDVLEMLKKHFLKAPSLSTSLKENDRQSLFMNLPNLTEFHQEFYKQILDYVSKYIANGNATSTNKAKKSLGAIFLEHKSNFLMYSSYCCDLPKAQILVDTLCAKDECIREAIMNCEIAANDGKFRFRDLLAVPMQRVLKYHLLLRELLSHTSSTHEEYSSLQSAHEAMLDVSEYINEVKRDFEQLQIISEIQASISDLHMPNGVELRDYGRLRKDAELKVQSHADQGKVKTRYVFVFDKVLLMCKAARGDNYSYKDSLKLTEYRVQEASLNHILEDSHNRWSHAFMLVHVQNLNVYTFFARTLDDKDKWIFAIREAMDNAYPNQRLASTHEAVMHTFEAADTACAHCGKLLKGLFYQGYRCHKCAKPMHKICISLLAKCGTASGNSAPNLPNLPPRPIHHRMSSCSLSDNNNKGAANTDYVNTNIEEHSWYVGSMDRSAAQKKLSPFPLSTFLVRSRGTLPTGDPLGYAISLKTSDEDIKHMKILSNLNDEFYLSDNLKFKSIVELVAYYSRHSLSESFSGLNTSLRFAVKDLFVVETVHKFDPEATSPNSSEKNLLALEVGERVVILDKLSETQGWWKAYNSMHRIGYIPKSFVKIVQDEPSAAQMTTNISVL